MNALITAALLCSGCASVSVSSYFGLAGSGGNASADVSPDAAKSTLRKAQKPPVKLIPRSHYSAFTFIDPAHWPPVRPSAAAQKHRTPRAKPPAHDLIIKPVATGKLTSGHGYRINPLTSKPKKHNGIDYAAPKGTEVFAAGSGIVERLYTSRSYGNYIRIRHANGYSTAYAHLNSFADGIKQGAKVTPKQVIGTVGSTGRSTGNHLHFELIYKGRPVDPLSNRVNTTLADNNKKSNLVAQN